MITQPSSARVLEAIRTSLRDQVAPRVSDEGTQRTLAMIDSLLFSTITRCDHEIAWMREEIAEIEATAGEILESGLDGVAALRAALEELRLRRSSSDHADDVRADYSRAGEVLSCSIELTMPVGGAIRDRVEKIFDARLARELDVRGSFALANRT
jgi:hypothetical protein